MRATYQGIAVASYNLGCFLGALITIFIGNPLGRKRMIILGTAIMVVGAILQASATTLEQLIIGRIITGLGNGGNTSTVSPPEFESRQKILTTQPTGTNMAVRNVQIPQTRQDGHDRGRSHYLRHYDQLLD
jgi:hypothetical protein